MNAKQTEMMNKIVSTYSFEHQREIFVEECAEAVQAVQKLKRSDVEDVPDRLQELCSEVADVLIMAEQMRMYLGADMVDMEIDRKLDRQLKRIQEEK